MEPPFLDTELRKLLLWFTLECFRRNSFKNRLIGLVGLVVCFKRDQKWVWLLNFARTSHTTVYQNPASTNLGSATANKGFMLPGQGKDVKQARGERSVDI